MHVNVVNIAVACMVILLQISPVHYCADVVSLALM